MSLCDFWDRRSIWRTLEPPSTGGVVKQSNFVTCDPRACNGGPSSSRRPVSFIISTKLWNIVVPNQREQRGRFGSRSCRDRATVHTPTRHSTCQPSRCPRRCAAGGRWKGPDHADRTADHLLLVEHVLVSQHGKMEGTEVRPVNSSWTTL